MPGGQTNGLVAWCVLDDRLLSPGRCAAMKKK
jgi:hypothetical protein